MARHQGRPMNIVPQGTQPNPQDPTAAALAALGGATGMTRTQTQYQTAITVQVPRDLEQVQARVLKEAAMAEESFIYAWEVNDKNSKTGKSRIQGVSIDGAMILIRNWGNAVPEISLEDETPTHYLLKATFIDLETGFSVPRLYRQRKGERHGKHDADRAEDIAFNIGQSKAQRNVIVKAIPSWLQDKAVDVALEAAAKKYQDVPASLAKVRTYAASQKITDEMLVRKVGKPFEEWLPFDIVLVRASFSVISKKTSTVVEEFGTPDEGPPPATITPDGEIIDAKGEPVPDSKGYGGAGTLAADPPAKQDGAVAPTPTPAAVTIPAEPPGPSHLHPKPIWCADCGKPIAEDVETVAIETDPPKHYHVDCWGIAQEKARRDAAGPAEEAKPAGKKKDDKREPGMD